MAKGQLRSNNLKSISREQFVKNFDEIMRQVIEQRRTVRITKNGKPLVVLEPCTVTQPSSASTPRKALMPR
jgi:prevent-host-death family protein